MMHKRCSQPPAVRNQLSTPTATLTVGSIHRGQAGATQGGRMEPAVGGAGGHHRGLPPSTRKHMPQRKRPDRRVTSQSTRIPRAGPACSDFPCGNPIFLAQGQLSGADASFQKWPHSHGHLHQTQIPPELSEDAQAMHTTLPAGK